MTCHSTRTGVPHAAIRTLPQDHGAVYPEGIFSPAERVWGGASWDEVFSGFCDGAQEAREAKQAFIAGMRRALCDETIKERLRGIRERFAW